MSKGGAADAELVFGLHKQHAVGSERSPGWDPIQGVAR